MAYTALSIALRGKNAISEVHVSQGRAETLLRRSGIANHRSIACSIHNISPKKSPKSVYVG